MLDHVDLLGDDVVYRRTTGGQRELVMDAGRCSGLERRFLAAVTGHTPLRVLLDMGFDGPGISAAVETLVAKRLIEPIART